MPATFKASRSRILSALVLCVFLYITYKYMYSSHTDGHDQPNRVHSDEQQTSLKERRVEKEGAGERRWRDKVKVTVFYECLCPDSRSFFLHHLLPSYQKAPTHMDVELVPYGKAKTFREEGGRYKFQCQHGPVECYGNKVHACAIDRLSDDQPKMIAYISCMINENVHPEDRGQQCAEMHGVDWKPVLDCARSEEGDLLLSKHGQTTDALTPPVSFIPTILLDKSRNDQPAILKNLWKEVCRRFPLESQPAKCLS